MYDPKHLSIYPFNVFSNNYLPQLDLLGGHVEVLTSGYLTDVHNIVAPKKHVVVGGGGGRLSGAPGLLLLDVAEEEVHVAIGGHESTNVGQAPLGANKHLLADEGLEHGGGEHLVGVCRHKLPKNLLF